MADAVKKPRLIRPCRIVGRDEVEKAKNVMARSVLEPQTVLGI
jgi:hypothetical protein